MNAPEYFWLASVLKKHGGELTPSSMAIITERLASNPPQAQAGAGDAEMLDWAVQRWHTEVANRPLVNIHRRSLDDVWRQVIRRCGADDVSLCGPRHDELRAAHDKAEEATERAAIRLYNASIGDAHNLHCRSWSELSSDDRIEWRNKAALEAKP